VDERFSRGEGGGGAPLSPPPNNIFPFCRGVWCPFPRKKRKEKGGLSSLSVRGGVEEGPVLFNLERGGALPRG